MGCFLETIWLTLTSFVRSGDPTPIKGHIFVDQEEIKNATVIVSKCEKCGKYDISWYK